MNEGESWPELEREKDEQSSESAYFISNFVCLTDIFVEPLNLPLF